MTHCTAVLVGRARKKNWTARRGSPVPSAVCRFWQHNTWAPATREYAWRVATGVAHVGASAVGWTGVELWECVCTMCAIASTDTDDSALLDSVEHRLTDCVMAKHAWAWASAVLVGAGIAYPGEAAGFWLYGGTLDCEIGCRRYLSRPDYGCHMREFQAAGVQLPPKIKCTRHETTISSQYVYWSP